MKTGFELVSPCPFTTTVTTRSQTPNFLFDFVLNIASLNANLDLLSAVDEYVN